MKNKISICILVVLGILLTVWVLESIDNRISQKQNNEDTQIQIAVELFSKRGAEGQTGHSENGISRSYESADVSPSLLKRITPLVGSVSQ